MIDDDATRLGDRPDPNTRPCEDCGHIWFAGERRHEYVDDRVEGHGEAEVLCALCRLERALKPPPESPNSRHWA